MTDRELMKWALYALEGSNAYDWPVVEELKERLAQPEHEPVALETVYDTIIQWYENDGKCSRRELARRIVALYTASRQWQGLTDEERGITAAETWGSVLIAPQSYQAFARAIEAKLKEKNT